MKSIATIVVGLALAATLAPAGASPRGRTEATWLSKAVATEAALSVEAPEAPAAARRLRTEDPVFGAPSPVPSETFSPVVPTVRMESATPRPTPWSQGPRTSVPGRP